MQLLIHSAAHLLVDAVCAAALFGPLKGGPDAAWRFMLYNTLAFSTQCLVGLAADRIGKHRLSAAAAMLCVAAGFALPLPVLPRLLLIGLGNSVFHVAAGTETIRRSGGRAAPLGVFVAPGAIGVTVGSLFPAAGPVLAGLLAVLGVASLFVKGRPEPRAEGPGRAEPEKTVRRPLLAAVLSVLTQAFSQSARRRETGEQAKAVGLAALLSAALLGLLLLCIPRESYKPPITWEDLTKKLERWGEEQNNRGNANAGLAGNPQTVDLTNLGALPNRPVPVLYVTSAKSAYLYLRGMSYAGFNGSSWSIGPVWQGSREVLYPYLRRNDGEHPCAGT